MYTGSTPVGTPHQNQMTMESLGLAGLVSHPPKITEKYNKLLTQIGTESMLIRFESFLDSDEFMDFIDSVENHLIENGTIPLTRLIFNDMEGSELKVGDEVVLLDTDDLEDTILDEDTTLRKGLVMKVSKLYDVETNYIEFDNYVGLYAHRVLKLKR